MVLFLKLGCEVEALFEAGGNIVAVLVAAVASDGEDVFGEITEVAVGFFLVGKHGEGIELAVKGGDFEAEERGRGFVAVEFFVFYDACEGFLVGVV